MTAAQAKAPGARKAKGEGHERRAEILDAAQRIFVEHGYEGATIRKIADAVGLSSTALYLHFREKGEILNEICRLTFERLLDANAGIAALDLPPEARMARMMRAYIDFAFENPDAYRLVYMTRPAEAREGAEAVASGDMGRALYAGFERVVQEVAAAGRLKRPPREAAQVLWAGGHGLASLMITKPYFDWAERERLIETMMTALTEGLLSR